MVELVQHTCMAVSFHSYPEWLLSPYVLHSFTVLYCCSEVVFLSTAACCAEPGRSRLTAPTGPNGLSLSFPHSSLPIPRSATVQEPSQHAGRDERWIEREEGEMRERGRLFQLDGMIPCRKKNYGEALCAIGVMLLFCYGAEEWCTLRCIFTA